MPTLVLYSTLGCHLCEQAKLNIWPVLEQYHCEFSEVDIADFPHLMDRYALAIPVLKLQHIEEELSWPFDKDQLRDYLARNSEMKLA